MTAKLQRNVGAWRSGCVAEEIENWQNKSNRVSRRDTFIEIWVYELN